MNTTKHNYITKEAAKNTIKNELILNAAYINGDWVTVEPSVINSNETGIHFLYDPSIGDVIAKTRLCTKAHVDDAALSTWSQTTVSERASYLNAIADAIEEQFEKLVALSVIE